MACISGCNNYQRSKRVKTLEEMEKTCVQLEIEAIKFDNDARYARPEIALLNWLQAQERRARAEVWRCRARICRLVDETYDQGGSAME
jgi:hypothetical protein